MTVVITGSNGFSAHYLARFIKENHLAPLIVGIDILQENRNKFVDTYFDLHHYHECAKTLLSTGERVRFFHLGGLLGNHPLPELIEANVQWTARFVNTASQVKHLQCFLNVGSSAEYGSQDVETLSESLTPIPVNNYGISKHLQTQLLCSFAKISTLNVVCTRTFNLIGPGLSENLVIGKMVKEFQKVKNGIAQSVELGRTDSKRDFVDVRDAVRMYWLLSERPQPGEIFNVGSGKSYQISDVFQICADIFGFSPSLRHLGVLPSSQDVDRQYADISKLKAAVAVEDFYTITQSVRDMIEASQ